MATYPDDATYDTVAMSDRKADRGVSYSATIPASSEFVSQAGYRKQRLVSRRKKRNYTISYTNISGKYKKAIENFYDTVNGTVDNFTFDLTHVNRLCTCYSS